MQAISCLFCTKPSPKIALKENGYTGRKCTDCGLIYISPRPTEQEIANLYGHDEAHIPAQAHIEQSFSKRLAARHALKIISKYKKTGTLLEIGAGAGYLLDEARSMGFEPVGIELNPTQADFIRTHFDIPCEQQQLSTQSFGTQRFDIVYHCDVISHFYDPIKAFKIINSKLNDQGLVIFETGNIADIDPKYYNSFTAFQYPDHLFFFGTKNIELLLEKTGFELVAYHRYNIVPQLKINKLLHSRYKPARVATSNVQKTPTTSIPPFKSLMRHAYRYGIHHVRYTLGSLLPKKSRPQTLIVVARKKSSF